MSLPRILDSKRTMLALIAALVVTAFIWFAGTNFSSQLGVKESVAQTMGAAGRALKQTNVALNSFIGRSPGERGATDVLKGKEKRLGKRLARANDNVTPTQRALGKIFDKPIDGIAETEAPQSVLASLPNELLSFSGPVPGLMPAALVSPGIFNPLSGGRSGGGFIGGIGGGSGAGGGSGGSGGIPIAPISPGIISAVPEPSTWVLLLFGFGAIGASVRRSNAISRRAGPCAQSC